MNNKKLEEIVTKHFEKEEKEIRSEFISLIIELINGKLVVIEKTIPKTTFSNGIATVTTGLRLRFTGMEELQELREMKLEFEKVKEENEYLKELLLNVGVVTFYED